MNKIITQLLERRGLDEGFLKPKYSDLSDPFLLPDMAEAAKRIREAIKTKEKILIYGDYDADGVTASTVMAEALEMAGLPKEDLEIMLPNRFTDGYGMNPRLVKHAKKQGINLVITVDCGSRNHEIIDELNKNNIDTIVTDHHELDDVLPSAIAVINPHRHDFEPTNGLDHLAGVGVAFKVAQALVKDGLIREGQEKWLLDLVAIGTICDSMVLTGENHILGAYGFIVLEKTRRPGLKELMRLARVKVIDSYAVGFVIGPRINAAGRLKDPRLALDLLRSTIVSEAAALASELEELNKTRRETQNSATNDITSRGVSDDPVIIESGPWHEGIIGIIAGRLVETYARPALVFAETEDGDLKGSGRSFGDFNLAEALNAVKDTIIGGGGHAGAAGVRVAADRLEDFKSAINDYYRSLNLKNQADYLKPTPDLTISDFSDFTLDLLEDLKSLEPFGEGNEDPLFRLENVNITSVSLMGKDKNHLRVDLEDQNHHHLKLVAFSAPEDWLRLTPDHEISPLIRLLVNDFNGIKSVEARIVDIIE